MSGQSSSIFSKFNDWSIAIKLAPDTISINGFDADRPATASDTFLQGVSTDIFGVLDRVQKEMRTSADKLSLKETSGQKFLDELAYHGSLAYKLLFKDPVGRDMLVGFLAKKNFLGPTFLSESVPFPWEVIFQGDSVSPAKYDEFWGFRYSPGRIIGTGKAFSLQAARAVQDLPADMLFCLHHSLPHAANEEWLKVQDLVRTLPTSRFNLFSKMVTANVMDGMGFLRYLYGAGFTMLHFACHCRQVSTVDDELIISAIRDYQAIGKEEPDFPVKTGFFITEEGEFRNRPLVFLNACQSGTDTDPYRLTFNLPKMFMDHGAAALIATICPVADVFASEFSRKFYEFFLQTYKEGDLLNTRMVGEALRDTRRYFWEQYHNPLGLAYGLYSLAFYHLELPQSSIDTLGGGSLV